MLPIYNSLPVVNLRELRTSFNLFSDSLIIVVITSKLIDFSIFTSLIAITWWPTAILPFLYAEPSAFIRDISKCPGGDFVKENPKEPLPSCSKTAIYASKKVLWYFRGCTWDRYFPFYTWKSQCKIFIITFTQSVRTWITSHRRWYCRCFYDCH